MQDLIRNSNQSQGEIPQAQMNLLQDTLASANLNCMTWSQNIPVWVMNYFESHQLYNEKWAFLGITMVPLSSVSLYHKLRPYQRKQVLLELNRRNTLRQHADAWELINNVSDFIGCAFSSKFRKKIKKILKQKKIDDRVVKKQEILRADPEILSPIGKCIQEFY